MSYFLVDKNTFEAYFQPELVKRIATLLGGDPDLLFRLAESTDPDLAEYIHSTPSVPEFLRAARSMDLTSEDFEVLIEVVKQNRALAEQTGEGSTPAHPRSNSSDD